MLLGDHKERHNVDQRFLPEKMTVTIVVYRYQPSLKQRQTSNCEVQNLTSSFVVSICTGYPISSKDIFWNPTNRNHAYWELLRSNQELGFITTGKQRCCSIQHRRPTLHYNPSTSGQFAAEHQKYGSLSACLWS